MDLYDPTTRCFNPGELRLAMIRRRMTVDDLVLHTRLARSTLQKARSGRPVADTTAIEIFRELARVAPMDVL